MRKTIIWKQENEFQWGIQRFPRMRAKSIVKQNTSGGKEKRGEARAKRVDENSGFTHRALQNRREKQKAIRLPSLRVFLFKTKK